MRRSHHGLLTFILGRNIDHLSILTRQNSAVRLESEVVGPPRQQESSGDFHCAVRIAGDPAAASDVTHKSHTAEGQRQDYSDRG